MKSEEKIKAQLVEKLKEQISALEKNDTFNYQILRQQIPVLEDVLELNIYRR